MTSPFTGERVETLAIAMAAAHGVPWDRMEPSGRAYHRRSASGALYRLGGEAEAQAGGLAHLIAAAEAFAEAAEAACQHARIAALPEALQDALHIANAQANLMLAVWDGLIPEAPEIDLPAIAEAIIEATATTQPAAQVETQAAVEEVEEEAV